MKYLGVILCMCLLLSSCFDKEEPWERTLVNAGEVISLGSEYKNQVFYNLGTSSVISSNEYSIWDLGFNSQGDAFYVRLNAARQMGVYNTESTNFAAISEISSSWELRYDNPHGGDDNLAIDVRLNASPYDSIIVNSNVYIIYRGTDASGGVLATPIKFRIESIKNNAYHIRYANLNGTEEHTAIIPKDPTLSQVAFTFDRQDKLPLVEPDINTWDILFSRFTDTVYTIDGSQFLTGYAVTGAYLNQANTSAYVVNSDGYDNFTSTDVDASLFTNRLNVIGHDWKIFQDVYTILDDKFYIIKDKDGLLYKFRFLNFYNPENGLKGYPEIQFELL